MNQTYEMFPLVLVISSYCNSRVLFVKLPVAFLIVGKKKEIDKKAKKHNPLVFFIQSWQQLQTPGLKNFLTPENLLQLEIHQSTS